uniref:CRC domain-containing protein n=1 Tax=Ananas comosus var. bracteatus TaxID=296719 RepID=A0A6V7NZK1_ANACO|nr:unnamed protein product [Ananas comosus var. bracteatus]
MHFPSTPIANNSVGDIYHENSSNYIESKLGSNAELAMNLQSDIFPRVSTFSCVVPETHSSDIRSFEDLMQNPSSLESNIFDNFGDLSMNNTVERDAIVDLSLPERIPVSVAVEGPNCKCEKSQCLQFYCGCLSRERYCNEHCGCKNCHNNKEHKAEVSNVIARAEISNRHAINADRTRKSGCNCEKSQCIKRYCECYKVCYSLVAYFDTSSVGCSSLSMYSYLV